MADESRIHIEGLTPGDVALLKDVAEAAAEKAVKKTFTMMGLDPNDPIKAQEEFSLMRYVNAKAQDAELKDDLSWLRRARKRSDGVIGKAILSAISIGVAGALMAFWLGFKVIVAQH